MSEDEGSGEKLWYCYMLVSTDRKKTYVGATVNPDRRLRQHNGELVGGARATKGRSWRRVFLIGQFASEVPALQFEWRWKQIGCTQCKFIKNPIERRLRSLKVLLSLEKPTEQAIPYDAYPDKIEIVWDSEHLKERYHLT